MARVLLFNRFACFWPKGYEGRSLVKSHQNGDYLKEPMRKTCLLTGFEPAAFGLPWITEQWTGNPKDAGLNSVGRQVFCIGSFK